jgi:hypothetical protein
MFAKGSRLEVLMGRLQHGGALERVFGFASTEHYTMAVHEWTGSLGIFEAHWGHGVRGGTLCWHVVRAVCLQGKAVNQALEDQKIQQEWGAQSKAVYRYLHADIFLALRSELTSAQAVDELFVTRFRALQQTQPFQRRSSRGTLGYPEAVWDPVVLWLDEPTIEETVRERCAEENEDFMSLRASAMPKLASSGSC